MDALLALEDGRTFACRSFTGPGEATGEVVFNTSMTGYQEVLTDPSYSGQMVVMTYPLIGNYGVNPEDIESERIQVAAFLIKEYQAYPSNFRSTATLADYLASQGVHTGAALERDWRYCILCGDALVGARAFGRRCGRCHAAPCKH